MSRWPRPLDPVRSIKLKLGLLVVGSTGAALIFFRYQIGWLPPRTSVTALVIALVTTQLLAHGMTKPLRQMTAAARAMAGGDYSRRVRATSRDEVGDLAKAFNTMAADLGAADRQRREMIANVSHELRTPITALQAVLENAVDGVTKPDDATLRTALGQTERLGKLVTELLDLSRIDAGAHPLRRELFEVEPLLRRAVAEARVGAPDTEFVIVVTPPGAAVFADAERLHQVVANLLDNAVRHGPSRGLVRVIVTITENSTAIEIADQGPGIAPEERERVFERFTRGERAGDGGTGLGLAIARWVVDLHGGRIAVVGPASPASSGEADGCRIRLDLPTRS